MGNAPRIELSAKEKIRFGIFHSVVWSVFLLFLIVYTVYDHTFWAMKIFLIYVSGLQVYVGIKTFKEGKRAQAIYAALINKENKQNGQT